MWAIRWLSSARMPSSRFLYLSFYSALALTRASSKSSWSWDESCSLASRAICSWISFWVASSRDRSANLKYIRIITKLTNYWNFSKSKDFIPELSFPSSEPLEVVYQTKLVGTIIASNLSWGPHVEYTTKNANSKLWLLIRFKARGGSTDQLLTLFQLKIRTLAEFAAPAFHGALTQQQSDDLEMIQKKSIWVHSRAQL